MRRRAKPAKAKAKAKPPRARKEVRELEQRLAESLAREKAKDRELTAALDTQTATSDILRAISRSSTDVQPVFQAIVDSARRLLHGNSSVMARIIGDRIELAAYTRAGATADTL